MFWPRCLLPLCAALLILAGCGGGTSDAAIDPAAEPELGPQLFAQPGSASHVALTWSGGLAGSAWRLERRREDDGSDYGLVADVDSAARLWLDSGLRADTAYTYRLRRADGSVLATTATRTGTEAALTTAAPATVGSALALPLSPSTGQLSLPDGSLQLELPAGSLSQSGSATLQPVANPLPDGDGLGLTLSLPERPARALTLSLRYGADEDPDELLQDRLALRQADGSWWLLPLATFDPAQRLLQVSLPPSIWVARPTASAQGTRAALAAPGGVQGTLVRVKAHKLVPAAATVRVLGRQRFVPVSIYRVTVGNITHCDKLADDELCAPTPILADQTLPIRNDRAGFRREWTLEGSTTPDATLGSLAAEPQAGVVYTAPAQVPASNPLTLRFSSVNSSNGRRLVLSAKIRVTEDAWVGTLNAFVGAGTDGDYNSADTHWSLDAAQSSPTRRVYRPSGTASVHQQMPPPCAYTVSPAKVTLEQARTNGQLVVDESTSPARYQLELATRWDATLQIRCPSGSTSAATKAGHAWSAEGVVSNGRIQGSDNGLGQRSWSLGRPQ